MNAAERVARKIQHDNGPEVRVVAGTRHYKIVVRGRLAGILPYRQAKEGISANLRSQLRRAGVTLP